MSPARGQARACPGLRRGRRPRATVLAGTVHALPAGMALVNFVDVNGWPVCPTCGDAIRPGEGAASVDDCIVHARCLPVARRQPDPCTPAPG